jgi:RimJ/RimL family protein N-acetyltransferase
MAQVEEKGHCWITYWLIVAEDAAGAGLLGIGLVGFKGAPDSKGEVEIGYGIIPDWRNMGYATEAVRAMIAWALEDPQCNAVIALTAPRGNLASNRVLEKAGLRIYARSDEALSWRIDREHAEPSRWPGR